MQENIAESWKFPPIKIMILFVAILFLVFLIARNILETDQMVLSSLPIPPKNFELDGNLAKNVVQQIHEKNCKKIFFLTINNLTKLTPVQSCGIISAARLNPQLCVIHLSQTTAKDQFQTTKLPPNLHLYQLNLREWLLDTPLIEWYEKTINNTDWYHVLELSDALRLAVLYKVGGIYLDTDNSIRPLDNSSLGGFAVWEGSNYLANSALEFPRFSMFVFSLMKAFAAGFQPQKQGPDLITKVYFAHKRVIEKQPCQKYQADCYDTLNPIDTKKVFPVNYSSFEKLYKKPNRDEVWRSALNSTLIHIWSSMLFYTHKQNMFIEEGSFLHDLITGDSCK